METNPTVSARLTRNSGPPSADEFFPSPVAINRMRGRAKVSTRENGARSWAVASALSRTLSDHGHVGTAAARRSRIAAPSVTQVASGQRDENVLEGDLSVRRLEDPGIVAMGGDEVGRRAHGQDLPVVHDGDAIADRLRLLHRMGREQDAAALLAEPLDPFP